MLAENDVCDLINSNQIDEVWFMGFGNAGFWEANMTGTGAFWTNGPIVTGTGCNRPTHIMGFNYELPSDFALHSFGHRIEGTMRNFLPNDFAQFTLYGQNGNSSCGNVHFPPNGNVDYDYNDTAFTNSDCMNWNVNHTGARSSINCTTWGCNQLGYMTWWMQHIPTDWWKYIVSPSDVNFKIKLQSLNVTGPNDTLTILLRKNNSVIYMQNAGAVSDSNGIYSVGITNIIPDTYDIYIKDGTHLEKKYANVSLVTGLNSEDWTRSPLLAGDFDNNNKINITDIGKILSRYTSLEVPVNSNNQIYDVNADGNINIKDITIALSNYTALEVPGD